MTMLATTMMPPTDEVVVVVEEEEKEGLNTVNIVFLFSPCLLVSKTQCNYLSYTRSLW